MSTRSCSLSSCQRRERQLSHLGLGELLRRGSEEERVTSSRAHARRSQWHGEVGRPGRGTRTPAGTLAAEGTPRGGAAYPGVMVSPSVKVCCLCFQEAHQPNERNISQ